MNKLLIFLWIFFTVPVYATDFSQIPLKGKGDFNYFLFDIYKIELYSGASEPKHLYDSPLKLKLIYERDFSAKDIIKRSLSEMKDAGVSQTKFQAYKRYLRKLIPDIKEGDSLSALYIPDSGLKILLNEKDNSVKIQNDEFCLDFLNIWLGPKTSAPKLRKKLLGID